MLAYRVELARAFDLEKNRSHVSRSSRPNPLTYVARYESWHSRLCAWPWKAPTKHLWFFSLAEGPSELLPRVVPNLHPTSYPAPRFGPKASKRLSTTAKGYLALDVCQYLSGGKGKANVQLSTPNHICNHQNKAVSTESDENPRLVKNPPDARSDVVNHVLPAAGARVFVWTIFLPLLSLRCTRISKHLYAVEGGSPHVLGS